MYLRYAAERVRVLNMLLRLLANLRVCQYLAEVLSSLNLSVVRTNGVYVMLERLHAAIEGIQRHSTNVVCPAAQTLSANAFGIPVWLTGLVLAAMSAAIFLGGTQRLASVTEKLVPAISNNPADNVAHFAHLGGLIFAFLLIMVWKKKHRLYGRN